MCEGAGPSSAPQISDEADAEEASACLAAEIGELGRMLAQVKIDIAAIKTDDFNGCHIPAANEELHAIVAQTEAATNEILDACEAMEPLTQQLDDTAAAQVQAATMRIFEACGFQDIIGQRITKVMSTLKTIDMKVERIIGTFGTVPTPDGDAPADGAPVSRQARPVSQVRLMNGPQLPSLAMAQPDIDRLLAGS